MKIFRASIIALFLVLLAVSGTLAEPQSYSFAAIKANGAWDKAKIDDREAIITDKAKANAYIKIEVPQDGIYQLYIGLYHNWRKFCPYLYVEAVDSNRKKFSGYVYSEPRWYMEKGQGRWEFRSPSATPFWRLTKGEMKIKFWLVAMNSCWEHKEVEVEDLVAVDEFVLIPFNENTRIQYNIIR
ncbi:MAG: hypothetical protein ABII88_00440 [Candidatus Omnitrophota bacterium]